MSDNVLPPWQWEHSTVACTTPSDNTVPVHSLNADGILCRWWGDVNHPPKGYAVISMLAALMASHKRATLAMAHLMMTTLSDEERHEIISRYCYYCGRGQDDSCKCYCNRNA